MKKKILIIAIFFIMFSILTGFTTCGSRRMRFGLGEDKPLYKLAVYCFDDIVSFKTLWFENNNDGTMTTSCNRIMTRDKVIYLYDINYSKEYVDYVKVYPLKAFLYSDHELSAYELEQFLKSNNWYDQLEIGTENTVKHDELYYVKDKNIDNPSQLIEQEFKKMSFSLGDTINFVEKKGTYWNKYETEAGYCYPNKIVYVFTTEYGEEVLRYLVLVEYLGNGKIAIAEDDVFLLNDCDLTELSSFINQKIVVSWKGYEVGPDELKYLEYD